MEVVFRVDASTAIGTGHVMRCLTLADTLRDRGADCSFVHRLKSGNMADTILKRGYAVHTLPVPITEPAEDKLVGDHALWLGVRPEQDALETYEVFRGNRPDWLVVDHYALDAAWEENLRPFCKKIAVIDDLGNRTHQCDLLLDQTHGKDAGAYRFLVPPSCRVLVGSKYALLRDEFEKARRKALERREMLKNGVRGILVCMGGSDPENVTTTALHGISRSGLTVKIDVMIGGSSPNLGSLRQSASHRSDVHMHIDTEDVPKLMTHADLAIGAGGTTCWERCCMGLPALAIRTAENQRFNIAMLAAEGAVVDMGCVGSDLDSRIADKLSALSSDSERLFAMSLSARRICDGKGAQRVADSLVSE